MKINSIGSDAIQVQIDGEDYSIADIVHKELLNVRHVKFAGVAPPHPLIKTLSIQVHTDGSAGAEANELLKEAVSQAQAKMNEIMEAAKEAFPDAIKPVRSRPPPVESAKELVQTVSQRPEKVEPVEATASVASTQSPEVETQTQETP